jgi:imidazolonepropionase
MHKRLWQNCHVATMVGGTYSIIEDAAIVTAGEHIDWVGPRSEVLAQQGVEIIDLDGAWVTPGLIDCHTHTVFGGNRSGEFEQRLQGVTYAEIAAAGGGIASTVRATRAATEAQLFASARQRLDALRRDGVTTVEIKSGYGLDLPNEAKMLRVARRLGAELPVTVRATCLAAHALPPEYADRADDYIAHICDVMLPALAAEGLVDAVDAFCGCSSRRRRWGCRSSCTPSSCHRWPAPRWRRATKRCRLTIWNS